MNRSQRRIPAYITALFVFMCLSLVLSFAGQGSVFEIFAGTKRYYQLWGLMLVLAIMPTDQISQRRIESWLKFVFIVALLQLPLAIFQRLVLVPKRVGMGGGIVPIDIVSGTFEASLEGGGSSSIMCIFLIVFLAYVFSAWNEKLISTGKMAVLALILGAPLFIGETKLVLILLPMMFLMVFSVNIRRQPGKAIGALIAAILLTVFAAWIYFDIMAPGTLSLDQQLQRSIDYNFGNVGYYDRYSLNRKTAITFWFGQHGMNNPVETMFGHGIGSSYSGSGSSFVPGHLNHSYPRMTINLTVLSTLLWDTGVLGTMIFIGAFISAWRASTRLMRIATTGEDRSRTLALRVSLACSFFSMIYSNSMLVSMSHETIFAVTLGYLAWLGRAKNISPLAATQHNDNTTPLPHARALPQLQA